MNSGWPTDAELGNMDARGEVLVVGMVRRSDSRYVSVDVAPLFARTTSGKDEVLAVLERQLGEPGIVRWGSRLPGAPY